MRQWTVRACRWRARRSRAWDLIAGRLVRPFALDLPVPLRLLDRVPEGDRQLPKIAAFREWLLGEAAADARGLERLKKARKRR